MSGLVGSQSTVIGREFVGSETESEKARLEPHCGALSAGLGGAELEDEDSLTDSEFLTLTPRAMILPCPCV